MRIDSSAIQAAIIGRNSEPVRELSEGDVIRAQVVSVKGDQAQLKTPQGVTIRATLLTGEGVAEGDRLTLSVVSTTSEQIVMKLMPEDAALRGQMDPTMILKGAGLPATKQNMAILTVMQDCGVTLDAGTVRAAAALMEAHPNLDVATAVFMATHELSGTQQQLSVLAGLMSGEARVGEAMADIIGQLSNFLGNEPIELADPGAQGQQPALAFQGAEARLLLPGEMPAQGAASVPQGPTLTAEPGMASPMMTFAAPSRETVAAFGRFLAIHHPEAAETLPQNLMAGALTIARAAAVLPEAEGRNIIAAFVETAHPASPLEARSEVAAAMNEVAAALRSPEGLSAGEPSAVIRNVISFMEGLFAKLDHDVTAQQVQNAASGLRPGMETVRRSLLSAEIPQESAALQRSEQLIDQTRVTDSFQRFVYLQIPMQIAQRNTTAELYVMKRQNQRKKIDPENTTLLVALETEHIGRVESMIRVEGKAVSLRFRLITERLGDAFIEHTAELQGMLLESGYRLVDIRCQLLDQPITPLSVERVLLESFGLSPTRVEIMV